MAQNNNIFYKWWISCLLKKAIALTCKKLKIWVLDKHKTINLKIKQFEAKTQGEKNNPKSKEKSVNNLWDITVYKGK